MTRFAYLDHPGPIPWAHRGGAGTWPENTMPAFAGAVALGYRYLETDVHVTADGVLLAFHDDRLDRVTDRTGVIAELPYAQVKQARVGGTEPIPLLEDVLGTWPDVRVNIDPKHDRAVLPLARVLKRMGAIDRVGVTAFSDARIVGMRALVGPRLCVGMGPLGIATVRGATRGVRGAGWLAERWGAACVQVPVFWRGVPLVDERFVEVAQGLGLAVHVWTINDGAEMSRLLDLGVDGIMTDHPGVLKDVLVARGQWV